MDTYDLQGQRKRREQIVEATMQRYGHLLTDDEAFQKWKADSGMRDALFWVYGLLAVDTSYDDFLRKLWTSFAPEDWTRFCTFTPFMSMVLILMYPDKLSPDLVHPMEEKILTSMACNCLPSYDFVGVNDNTPAMIMALLFLAGEYFDNAKWTALAYERLAQFEQMLSDRTMISEFNSPTYHPVTVFAFACLVNCTRDKTLRERALLCEKELWRMAFATYHPSICHAAGPYSRAYRVDSTAHTHQYRMIFFQVLGEEKMPINPLNTLYREWDGYDGITLHGGNGEPWFLMFSNCFLAGIDYHCPPEVMEEALARTYPYWMSGTAQVSASADTHLLPSFDGESSLLTEDLSELYEQEDLVEYGAGVTRLFSYLSEHFAMGTCTKEFHNGDQTDSFHVLLSRKYPAQIQEDISSIYTRYTFNNETPAEGLISDRGRKLAFQMKNTAMVLYSPKTMRQNLSSMKLAILIDNRYGAVKEVRDAKGVLTEGDTTNASGPVFVRFSEVYLTIHPLVAHTQAAVRLECIHEALSVSIVNYEGVETYFPRKKLKLTPSGFVCEIRERDEYHDFTEFIEEMSAVEISDVLYANLHTRYAFERRVSYQRGDTKLECCYSPVTEGIRYIRANGNNLQ